MSRFSVEVFGREVFSVNLTKDAPAAGEEPQMGGGGGHNFDRREEYDFAVDNARAFGFRSRS